MLFGAEFADATGVGRVLLVAGIVFALNRVLESLLQAVGRPLESSIGEGVALAVTAAGLTLLLPTLGIMGAGVTSLLAYSASSAFMVRRAARAPGSPGNAPAQARMGGDPKYPIPLSFRSSITDVNCDSHRATLKRTLSHRR